jgi:hypothetical protein
MIARSSSLALCLALALGVVAAPRPAIAGGPPAPAAQPPKRVRDALSGDARAAFDRAAELFLDGNFAAARVEYERAHALSKEPRVLYNVATCEKAMRHYTRAIAALEASLAEGGDRLPSTYTSLAQETLGVLRPFVTTLTVAADPPGATLTLDGEPLDPASKSGVGLPIDVGEHVVVARSPGFEDATVKVTAVGGVPARVLAKLLPLAVRQGSLHIVTDEPTSIIQVDDARAGSGEWAGRVSEGEHRIQVTRGGFYPYASEVVVRDGETRTISVSLSRRVPVWVWIVGSAVVVGATTVGVVVGTSKTQYNGSAPGTLPPKVVTAGFGSGGISW